MMSQMLLSPWCSWVSRHNMYRKANNTEFQLICETNWEFGSLISFLIRWSVKANFSQWTNEKWIVITYLIFWKVYYHRDELWIWMRCENGYREMNFCVFYHSRRIRSDGKSKVSVFFQTDQTQIALSCITYHQYILRKIFLQIQSCKQDVGESGEHEKGTELLWSSFI